MFPLPPSLLGSSSCCLIGSEVGAYEASRCEGRLNLHLVAHRGCVGAVTVEALRVQTRASVCERQETGHSLSESVLS